MFGGGDLTAMAWGFAVDEAWDIELQVRAERLNTSNL